MAANKENWHLSLNDHQKFTLMKFRKKVADCCTKTYHDDRYLLRWLRARKFDVNAAENMLRDSMEWRKKWGIDDLGDWPIPEVYEKYYPYGVSGFDKEGSPVVVIPFEGFDSYGLLHSSTKIDMVRVTAKILESILCLARERASQYGPNALKVTCIIDMVNFNLKQFTFRPAAEMVITLIQMYEANYPEILKECYIINVPRVFMFAFNVVKNFLNEYTLGKIMLFRTAETEKWKAALLKAIDADQLPLYFGGTMTDPDGNPKCITKINQGGKVPKSYYIKKGEIVRCEDNYSTLVVKKGDKTKLEFSPDRDGCFLRWSFYTEGYDVKFGIKNVRKDTNETEWEVPMRKVRSHESEEIGFIVCKADLTYCVIFDNKYSFLRNKTVNYRIGLTPPIEKNAVCVESEEI